MDSKNANSFISGFYPCLLCSRVNPAIGCCEILDEVLAASSSMSKMKSLPGAGLGSPFMDSSASQCFWLGCGKMDG